MASVGSELVALPSEPVTVGPVYHLTLAAGHARAMGCKVAVVSIL
jgi:hypothetical protein